MNIIIEALKTVVAFAALCAGAFLLEQGVEVLAPVVVWAFDFLADFLPKFLIVVGFMAAAVAINKLILR
jgi:hypothetical protein